MCGTVMSCYDKGKKLNCGDKKSGCNCLDPKYCKIPKEKKQKVRYGGCKKCLSKTLTKGEVYA